MKPTILQALVICLAASAANAADVTWPGGSGDLASAAAWGRDVVPGASDKVFRARIRCIPGGCVSVTKVDMVTSTIEVAVKVPRGMIITFR